MAQVPPLWRMFAVALIGGAFPAESQAGPIVISGWLTNVQNDDSPYEYTQLVATQNINFAVTPYTVVWNDVGVTGTTGTASFSDGWSGGSLLTYAFQINSGSVSRGEVFYVGGSAKLISGPNSTSLAGEKWLRSINTGTTNGDTLGTFDSPGVLGNGGPHKDGIAVFVGLAAGITTTTVPIDSLFFGDPNTSIGNAYPGAGNGGFKAAQNDHYTSNGVFGDTGNTFFFPDLAQNQFMHMKGTYNTATGQWETARTATVLTLSSGSATTAIAPEITLVPEAGSGVLASIGALLGGTRRRKRQR